jgi:uncharacterized protein YukE
MAHHSTSFHGADSPPAQPIRFGSFTPEGMRHFAESLAALAQQRLQMLEHTRDETRAMLARFTDERRDQERQRQQNSQQIAQARRVHISELKAGMTSLMGRFRLSRQETAGQLREMANELRATAQAFRDGFRAPSKATAERTPPPPSTQWSPPSEEARNFNQFDQPGKE